MRTYYIYKVTDLINGKIYIGQTNKYHERRLQHERCSPNEDCDFHRAIQEHGKENFRWEVICTTTSKEEANELEKRYIAEYNTYREGYNMTKGGIGASMWNARPVVCLDLDGTFVKRYDSANEAEHTDGYWNVVQCCRGNLRQSCGKQFMFEDEYLANGPKVYEKPKSASVKAIVQCDLDGNLIERFDSVVHAAEKTGVRRSTISGAITGTYKNAGGFIWVYEKDYPIKDISKYVHRKKGRKVAQIDPKTGEVIKVFDRMADAGRELGVNYKGIHKVIDKPTRTAYGFRWESQ